MGHDEVLGPLDRLVREGSRSKPATLFLVDDDPDVRAIASLFLTDAGFHVRELEDGRSCLLALDREVPDAIILDLDMPGLDGFDVLRQVKAKHQVIPIIVMTATRDVETAVSAMKVGAYDYVTKPADPQRIVTTARNATEMHRMAMRLIHLERQVGGPSYGELVGASPAMRALFREMDRVAASDVTVLINGESGTGKELVARGIHSASSRSRAPFVALNCAAVPETLQESELFGHERGAFTGALARREGKFEQARGGTLFLDEVAELSPSLQAKLLRVLQERRIQRVGGSQEIPVDLRVISATHRNLADEVREGRFREDLYFRLAVYDLELPPLRDRGDDVIRLAASFIERYHASGVAGAGDACPSLSPEATVCLLAWPWPGNVRELQNAMQRALVACTGERIQVEHLPPALRRNEAVFAPPPLVSSRTPAEAPADVDLARHDLASEEGPDERRLPEPLGPVLSLAEVERLALVRALDAERWNLSGASRRLGIGRTTLYRKLARHGLSEDPSVMGYEPELGRAAALPEGPLELIERVAIERAVEAAAGNLARASRVLGLSRSALYNRLRTWRSG